MFSVFALSRTALKVWDDLVDHDDADDDRLLALGLDLR